MITLVFVFPDTTRETHLAPAVPLVGGWVKLERLSDLPSQTWMVARVVWSVNPDAANPPDMCVFVYLTDAS